MANVQCAIEKDTLVIRVKADPNSIKAAPASKTGKTRLLASTHGALAVATPHGELKVALNVMVPAAA